MTLVSDLQNAISGEVRFDAGSRALYATDGSNYRQPPIGVVIPRTVDDVVRAVDVCRRHGAPIFGRGGGTSLAGQCCNAAVCFDMSKYLNRVLEIDTARRHGRAQPGTILDDLRHAAEAHGLTFGPDPATHNHCTIGGMIGNNSCGVHSVMAQFYGPGPRTADNVDWLDVLTYDGVRLRVGPTAPPELDRLMAEPGRVGDIYRRLKALVDRYEPEIRGRMPNIPRRVSGYNLTALLPEHGFNVAQALVGTESTCVLVLEASLCLVPNPKARSLIVLGYPSVYEAADHIPEVMQHKPIGCEGMDDLLVKDIEEIGYESQTLQVLPQGQGWLLVEFGGETREESDARARALADALKRGPHPPSMKIFDDAAEEKKVWKVREAGLGATAHVDRARPTWEGWEDSAVPPERLGEYLRGFRKLLDQHKLQGDLYGHFGQGCVHTRIDFDLETVDGIRNYRSFVESAADLVISLGGSLSGEHGDGQSRGELLPRMYGAELMEAFHEFKSIWDPAWKMNPGKVLKPYRLDENLRLGTTYHPPHVTTHFYFANAAGSFAKETLRCVGVGECRRLEGGTMCPSFRVTREEMHSTRGRARLLFEMLQGDPLKGGWQDEHVKEALDLCLACKGCKGDCPVSVDMATYKAEFLSHYFEKHRRPVTAYAFGLIHYWARLGSLAPAIVNAVTQTPGLAGVAKRLAGMAPERRVPAFAPFTFKDWFHSRPPRRREKRPRVMLWPDTFNNHFHPHTAIAAVHVLEHAGFDVVVPRQPMCCGRPLYDYGFLSTAKRWLRHILRTLAVEIDQGAPVIGLEPSCVAVFRDEMTQLLPDHEGAKRLARQTFTLAEFLNDHGFEYPSIARKAIVHGHCHHKAVMKLDDERRAVSAMHLDADVLDNGCCGMAGSFGFERDHYDISMRVAEHELLPALRRTPDDALVIADGFSCRTQIEQATGRHALHLAEVIDLGIRSSSPAV
ncbi:MAG TPA: FAD-binding and (Fe-S)-binding domain-containing protein [Vicinamibacterales bacterium]|nr:FAD-binding and (Fe-S)-binding domain-containing protein [Vicinamibacterales bacterium]